MYEILKKLRRVLESSQLSNYAAKIEAAHSIKLLAERLNEVADIVMQYYDKDVIKALSFAETDRVPKVQAAAHEARKAWEMLREKAKYTGPVEGEKKSQWKNLKERLGFSAESGKMTKLGVMRQLAKLRKSKEITGNDMEKSNEIIARWKSALYTGKYLKRGMGLGGGFVPLPETKASPKKKQRPNIKEVIVKMRAERKNKLDNVELDRFGVQKPIEQIKEVPKEDIRASKEQFEEVKDVKSKDAPIKEDKDNEVSESTNKDIKIHIEDKFELIKEKNIENKEEDLIVDEVKKELEIKSIQQDEEVHEFRMKKDNKHLIEEQHKNVKENIQEEIPNVQTEVLSNEKELLEKPKVKDESKKKIFNFIEDNVESGESAINYTHTANKRQPVYNLNKKEPDNEDIKEENANVIKEQNENAELNIDNEDVSEYNINRKELSNNIPQNNSIDREESEEHKIEEKIIKTEDNLIDDANTDNKNHAERKLSKEIIEVKENVNTNNLSDNNPLVIKQDKEDIKEPIGVDVEEQDSVNKTNPKVKEEPLNIATDTNNVIQEEKPNNIQEEVSPHIREKMLHITQEHIEYHKEEVKQVITEESKEVTVELNPLTPTIKDQKRVIQRRVVNSVEGQQLKKKEHSVNDQKTIKPIRYDISEVFEDYDPIKDRVLIPLYDLRTENNFDGTIQAEVTEEVPNTLANTICEQDSIIIQNYLDIMKQAQVGNTNTAIREMLASGNLICETNRR